MTAEGSPFSLITRLQIAAMPDYLIALVFLALWLEPGYFGVAGYDYLSKLYRVEALAVLSTFFISGSLWARHKRPKPKSMLARFIARGLPAGLILAVAGAFILSAAMQQPPSMVAAYIGLAFNRAMLVFLWPDAPDEKKRVVLTTIVVSIVLFFGCFLAAALLLPHLPDWGLTGETGMGLESTSRFQLESGPREDRPKLLAAFGVFYFGLQALLQSWAGFWNRVANGTSRLKLWRW